MERVVDTKRTVQDIGLTGGEFCPSGEHVAISADT